MSTNPKIENPKNTNNPAQPVPAPATAPQPTKAKTKMVSIQLNEETHQKLRIVALSKGATTSSLVEGYVDAAVRKDIIVAMAKLSE
jgi:hypothetical protein